MAKETPQTQSSKEFQDFRAKVEQLKLTCPMCGERQHSLASHVFKAHSMSPNDFAEKYGYQNLYSAFYLALTGSLGHAPADRPEDAEVVNYKHLLGKVSVSTPAWIEAMKAEFPPIDLPAGLDSAFEIPDIDPNFEFTPEMAAALTSAMSLGMHTYMSGPPGAGKTSPVTQLFAHLKRPVCRQNLNGDTTVESFKGSMRLIPGQGTIFRKGVLPMCLELNIPLIIDEIDYGQPGIMSVLNPILERGGAMLIEETGERIKVPKGWVAFATANTSGSGDTTGRHAGAEVMNTAIIDRFQIKLKVDYLPQKKEAELMKKVNPALDAEELRKVTSVIAKIREAYGKGQLPLPFGTRKSIDYAMMRKVDSSFTALQRLYLNWLEESDNLAVLKIMEDNGIRAS